MPTRGCGFLPRRFASTSTLRSDGHPPGGTSWPPAGSSAPNQKVPFGYAGERFPMFKATQKPERCV